jgi:hypothetical protein
MFRQILLCAGLFIFSATSSFSTDAQAGAGESARPPSRTVNLPGTRFEIVVGAPAFERDSTRIKPELLTAIVAWLSSNYGLPASDETPAIAFVTRDAMIALRRDRHSDDRSASQGAIDHGQVPHASTVVAVYDDVDRTIYLPEAWTGRTPVELSVLVHEMVHHLQNLAGLRFACPEEREQLAYAAQQDWLALFGRDLFTDFGTDAFTLMARTHCAY